MFVCTFSRAHGMNNRSHCTYLYDHLVACIVIMVFNKMTKQLGLNKSKSHSPSSPIILPVLHCTCFIAVSLGVLSFTIGKLVYVIHGAKGSLPWKVRLNMPMHVYNITPLSTCSPVEYYYYSLGSVLSALSCLHLGNE